MTLAFPLTPEMRARLDARDDVVTAARAILRSKARHAPSIIRWACNALMEYGNCWDWVEAYQELRALDAKPVRPTIDRPQAGTIRGWLMDCAGFAVIVAAALIVYMGGV